MRQILISIVLVLCSDLSVFGQADLQNIKNQPYLKYRDKVNCDSAFTTLELRICANINFQKSDSMLNDIYNSILREFEKLQSHKESEILQQSQREWIEYRDKYCKVYWTLYEGGTLQPVIYLDCLTDLTNHRKEELNKLLNEIRQ